MRISKYLYFDTNKSFAVVRIVLPQKKRKETKNKEQNDRKNER